MISASTIITGCPAAYGYGYTHWPFHPSSPRAYHTTQPDSVQPIHTVVTHTHIHYRLVYTIPYHIHTYIHAPYHTMPIFLSLRPEEAVSSFELRVYMPWLTSSSCWFDFLKFLLLHCAFMRFFDSVYIRVDIVGIYEWNRELFVDGIFDWVLVWIGLFHNPRTYKGLKIHIHTHI